MTDIDNSSSAVADSTVSNPFALDANSYPSVSGNSITFGGGGSSLSMDKEKFMQFCTYLEKMAESLESCNYNANEYDELLDEITPNFYERVKKGPLKLLKNSETGISDQLTEYRKTAADLDDYAKMILREVGWLSEYYGMPYYESSNEGFDGTGFPPAPSDDQGAYPSGYVGENPYVTVDNSSPSTEPVIAPILPIIGDSGVELPITSDNGYIDNGSFGGDSGSYTPSVDTVIEPVIELEPVLPDTNETEKYTQTVVDQLSTILNDLHNDEEGYTTGIIYTNTEQGEMQAVWVDLTNEDAIHSVLDQISSSQVDWGTTVSVIAYGGVTGATFIGELTSMTGANGSHITDAVNYNYTVVESGRPPVEDSLEDSHNEEEDNNSSDEENVFVPPEEGNSEIITDEPEDIDDLASEDEQEDLTPPAETGEASEELPPEDEQLTDPNVTVINAGPESIDITPTGYSNNYSDEIYLPGGGGTITYPEPVIDSQPEYVDPNEVIAEPIYEFDLKPTTVKIPVMPDTTVPGSLDAVSNQGIESVNITPLSGIVGSEPKEEITTTEEIKTSEFDDTPIGIGGIALGAATASAYGINKYKNEKDSEEDKEESKKENQQ